MWWYLLQGAVGGAVLWSDWMWQWGVSRISVGFLALLAAWTTSFMLAWIVDGAWKISAPEPPAEQERRPSGGAGAA